MNITAYFAIAVKELPGATSLSSAREDGAGKGVGRWRCASAHLPTPDLLLQQAGAYRCAGIPCSEL